MTLSGRPRPPAGPGRHAHSLSAFVWGRREAYRRYARARCGCAEAADAALDRALQRLEQLWPALLAGDSVAAGAWRILGECVLSACRPGTPHGDPPVHHLLPRPQADAVLLHYGLGMPLTGVAELTGIPAPAVAAHLLMAERSLPADSPHLRPHRRRDRS